MHRRHNRNAKEDSDDGMARERPGKPDILHPRDNEEGVDESREIEHHRVKRHGRHALHRVRVEDV